MRPLIACAVALLMSACSSSSTSVARSVKPPRGPNITGETLGCCHDRVGRFVWACRVTSLSECESVGLSCEEDRYCEDADWGFTPGTLDIQICGREC